MHESLRSALTDYVNQQGAAAVTVTSVEIYDGSGCSCCSGTPTVDINYRDGANWNQAHEVYDSELNDLLLFLLKATPQ